MATGRRTAILCGAALALGGVLIAPAPARAADVFVQVNPSTVEAGYMVGIKASCTSNTQPATVESSAFGTVTVEPQAGFLTAVATVPQSTRADTYRVRLSCPDGKNGSTRLMVVGATRPSRGPATGFGGTAGEDPGGLLVTGGLVTTAFGAVLGLIALRRRSRSATARRI
ncbi:hypothetical protein [Plantactinospora alkalitolerans]|uniref:hypothetical protein n=1 Tax=Plantactinospora alkalitolerans TaxID=2789879 RepID=UPI002B203311|nr:hypothetical protein [Plantactinospora alkalitolerans]